MTEEKIDDLLERQAKIISEEAGLEYEVVLEGIKAKVNEGYSPEAAIVVWKGENSLALGSTAVEWEARVIAKEPLRTTPPDADGNVNYVATVHFAVLDRETGELVFKPASIWTKDRIQKLYDKFEKGKAYTFKGSENNRGYLQRITKVEEVNSKIPTLDKIEITPLSDLENSAGAYDLTEGFVAKLISPDGNEVLGFEIGDLGRLSTVPVWVGGDLSPVEESTIAILKSLKKGDKVKVFGYVNAGKKGLNIRGIEIVK